MFGRYLDFRISSGYDFDCSSHSYYILNMFLIEVTYLTEFETILSLSVFSEKNYMFLKNEWYVFLFSCSYSEIERSCRPAKG